MNRCPMLDRKIGNTTNFKRSFMANKRNHCETARRTPYPVKHKSQPFIFASHPSCVRTLLRNSAQFLFSLTSSSSSSSCDCLAPSSRSVVRLSLTMVATTVVASLALSSFLTMSLSSIVVMMAFSLTLLLLGTLLGAHSTTWPLMMTKFGMSTGEGSWPHQNSCASLMTAA